MSSCHHDSLGRHIYQTAQTLKNYFEKLLSPFDLTGEQFHLLKNMDTNTGHSQNKLCRLVDKSPANLTRILDRLEKKGLIVRCDNPEDRRSSLVFQTESGLALTTQVSSMFLGLSQKIEKGIGNDEKIIFQNVLSQIDTNLQKLSEKNGD